MFDEICARLFGTGKENQKRLLIKLILISLLLVFITVILDISGGIVLVLLVWGWRALCACIGITQISKFFQYNVVIIVISIVAWLIVGTFAGIVVCIIGLIRFTQLEIERYNKKKSDSV